MVGSDTVPPSARDRAAALVGRVVSERYRIDEVLAMGGMGAVFRGEHIRMRKRVAIKVLHPETENLPELVARFEREAIAGAHIAHPNVASATDFGRLDDGSYYLVLEYVRGTTLSDLIQQGPLPAARATHIARQIAEALDAAHQMGVVHRDVKPRNVMIVAQSGDRSDKVKLIDFGLAKVPLDRFSSNGPDGDEEQQWTGTITATGIVFGTVAYMSPETGLGMEAVDARSDLYALGIIFYEMLVGVHPFDAIDPGALFLQQRTQKPPPMRVRAPNVVVPNALERITMRLLEKAPTSRFTDARALVEALDTAAAEARLDLDAPVPPPSSDQISIAGAIPISIPPPPRLSPPDAARPPRSPPPTTPPPPSPGYVPKLARKKPKPKGWSGEDWLRFIARTVILMAVAAVGLLGWKLLGDRPGFPALGLPALIAQDPPEVARTGIADQVPSELPETPPAVDDGAELRARIVSAAEGRAWPKGADAIAALAAKDPPSFRDKDVAAATIFILVNAAFEGGPAADRGFEALAKHAGPDGVDLLYDLYSTRGGSRAAGRAAELLRKREVLKNASPALKVAIALRDASCKEKPSLFERAVTEGDVRALAVLEILRSPQCRPKIGQCCFKKDAAIEKAVIALRAKLRE